MFFEVEPLASYSGSYVDNVLTGSLVNRTGTTISPGDRGLVGSTIMGDYSEYLAQTRLMHLADRFFNRVTKKVGFKRSIDLVDENERFYDTLLPDFKQITEINDAEYVSPTWYKYALNTTPDGYLGPEPLFFDCLKLILTVGGYPITGSDDNNISDNKWWFSYPFQYTYRNLLRNPSFSQNPVVNSYNEKRLNGNDLTSNPSGSLEYAPALTNITSSTDKFLLSFAYSGQGVNDVRMINFIDKSVQNIEANVATYTQQQSWFLDATTFTKLYFGFTKALRPSNLTTGVFNFGYNASSSYTVYAPVISESYSGSTISPFLDGSSLGTICYFANTIPPTNGWKYGLISGFPLLNKAVFRMNSYGQPRDMLEQPLTARTFSQQGIASEASVFVSFATGSQYYLTASEDKNYRSSGIYDFECKVGQPYVES